MLLVLFAPPAPIARLQQLMAALPALSGAGLRVIAIELGAPPEETTKGRRDPPLVVGTSSEATAALTLFRRAEDGGETELMLDRAGSVRARWTSNMPGGPAPPATLITDAGLVNRIAVAAPSHAAHMR